MFAVSYRHTMANAKRIVHERPEPTPRRDTLRDLSLAWIAKQNQEREDAERRVAEQREREKREWELSRRTTPAPSKTQPRELIARVAAWHGVTFDAIMSPDRSRVVVEARWDCIVAVHLNCEINGRAYTLNEMGRLFNRDHTSVLNGLRTRGLK